MMLSDRWNDDTEIHPQEVGITRFCATELKEAKAILTADIERLWDEWGKKNGHAIAPHFDSEFQDLKEQVIKRVEEL